MSEEQKGIMPINEEDTGGVTRRALLRIAIGTGLVTLLGGSIVAFGEFEKNRDKQLKQCESDAQAGHPHPTVTPNGGTPPEGYDACGNPIYPIGPVFGR